MSLIFTFVFAFLKLIAILLIEDSIFEIFLFASLYNLSIPDVCSILKFMSSIVIKSPIELTSSVRNSDGVPLALAKTVEGGSAVVAWKKSSWVLVPEGSFTVSDVLAAPEAAPDFLPIFRLLSLLDHVCVADAKVSATPLM